VALFVFGLSELKTTGCPLMATRTPPPAGHLSGSQEAGSDQPVAGTFQLISSLSRGQRSTHAMHNVELNWPSVSYLYSLHRGDLVICAKARVLDPAPRRLLAVGNL